LKQIHTIDVTGNTDGKIKAIITNAGRRSEKREAPRKNLGLRKPISQVGKDSQRRAQFDKETRFYKPKTFKNWFQDRPHNQ